MAQHNFNQFGNASHGGSIDPNDLAMGGGGSPSFANGNYNHNNQGSAPNTYSSGSAVFGDDELLYGLASPSDAQTGLSAPGQDFSSMSMGYSQGNYPSQRNNTGLQIDSSHMNGFSNTPDGDPIQSPFSASYNAQFRHMQPSAMQSPLSYSGSPYGGDMNADGADSNYLNAQARARMSQQMQRKGSSHARSPMTPKTQALHGLSLGSQESHGFGSQPIRTGGQDKPPHGQWLNTPAGSVPASYNSGFSSPMQQGMAQMNEVMMKGGTSMPAKLNTVGNNAVSSQEMKRKRRRESHNLVERRRRDNINERIQDLSRLVPMHRLEDEKVRKLLQNGTPLSPTLTGMASPTQATSGLAGPGARRAAGASAGNITTGLPVEDKDKGPNKGDILNGSVSWTRDLMWMLHLKLQQQDELMNIINDLGGHFPFELTDNERRMQSELMEAMTKNDPGIFTYSRAAGTGLRVPSHTDYRGEPIGPGAGVGDLSAVGLTPEPNGHGHLSNNHGNPDQFWVEDDDGSGHASLDFKEEDEFGMDLTN